MSRTITGKLALCLAAVLLTQNASARDWHVSPDGDDTAPGTRIQPLKTIQKAVNSAEPGDTVRLGEGTYRESVLLKSGGTADAPLRIMADEGELAVLDGTEPIAGPWVPAGDGVYKTALDLDAPLEQLFLGDAMMVEARWPNMRFPEQLWDRSAWASADAGSDKGRLVDEELKATGIDWTGATAVLNISHQWWTWTATVTRHAKNSDRLEYDLESLSSVYDKSGWIRFDDDFYYLFGKREALDAPGEWFFDGAARTLYFKPPGGTQPQPGGLRYKARTYGLDAEGVSHVELSDLQFFGCTFRFDRCDDCAVANCRLRFPTYSRLIPERYSGKRRGEAAATQMSGERNAVRRCAVEYASANGLHLRGANNLVEDCLVHDVNFSGTLDYAAIRVGDREHGNNTVRHNTVFRGGNALIVFSGPQHDIGFNHVHDGGYLCSDVSLIYTVLPRCAGSVIHHNWVHGCHAPKAGLGIRGDDKTRQLTMHHNVVWDCPWEGIVCKGDKNRLFNNTTFDNGQADVLVWSRSPEPDKHWHDQWPGIARENEHSLIQNNLALRIRGNRSQRSSMPPHGTRVANLETPEVRQWLVDPEQYDFRPRPGTPAVDGGKPVPGYEQPFTGAAPDVGAYEAGVERWMPGITWDPQQVLGERPAGFIQIPKRASEANGANR